MSNKPPSNEALSNEALKNRLSRLNEITITVVGRKSGRAISIPVWFVLEDNKLYLVPVTGSDTQCFESVLKKPLLRIHAGADKAELRVAPVTDPAQVSSIVEKFR